MSCSLLMNNTPSSTPNDSRRASTRLARVGTVVRGPAQLGRLATPAPASRQVYRQSIVYVAASVVLPLGGLLTVHMCDGVFEIAASACHREGAVLVVMVTAEMKCEAQLGGQPGHVIDYTGWQSAVLS